MSVRQARVVIPRKIQAVYDAVPNAGRCNRCGQCCGPVEMSSIEKTIILRYCSLHNIKVKDMFAPLILRVAKAVEGEWHCPMLENNQCLIYPVRPLICRLQGVISKLPCPNNKTGSYPLSDNRAAEMLHYLQRFSSQHTYTRALPEKEAL